MSELNSVLTEFIELVLKKEELIIKDVLKQLLKREATIEDFKKCTKYYENGNFDIQYLAYDGLLLGVIKRLYEPNKISVEFTPFDEKNFLEQAVINNKFNLK